MRYPVKTFTTPSAIRTGKWTVSSRWHSARIARMFGSRCSLSAALPNCSSATDHGSRWVWSMTTDFVATISSSVSRAADLFHDEPVVRGAARSVSAVPVLEYDTAKALCDQCLAPGAQSSCHERREADVAAGHQQALQMALALQQRDLQEGLAVDFEQVERGEDLPRAGVPHESVALRIELELRLIVPVRHEDAVDDRRRAVRLGDDRVIQLPGPVDLAAVADEVRSAEPDTHQRPRSHPIRLEDV